jgi:NitT/TauT family transport system permease protein
MVFLPPDRLNPALLARFARRRLAFNLADVVAFLLMVIIAVAIACGAHQMNQPLSRLDIAPVTLDPWRLPEYAVLSTLRMFAALFVSLIFTFTVATLAAKSRKAEMVIVPALDILQSIPILGFLSFTLVYFLNLFPGNELGAEAAAVFVIFTSQAWNMAFSFYQSMRTLPADLTEVSRGFGLSTWQRFWKLELPFAIPALVWNTMMSMSGAWFFVVASEYFSVGKTNVALPGIGSWLALAIDHQDFKAVGWAVLAMGVVILLYDQLLFRPIVAWADKFRFEQTASQDQPESWFYTLLTRTRLLRRIFQPIALPFKALPKPPRPRFRAPPPLNPLVSQGLDWLWLGAVIVAVLWGFGAVIIYVRQTISIAEALQVFGLGLLTLLRVVVLIAIASVIWVPIGIWIGLRPAMAEKAQPVAQFLAAFPANVVFPIVVVLILRFKLNPDIWLSFLIVFGTQWYILFNVIAGAMAFPNDLKEAVANLRIGGWEWWKSVMLPGIFPYYVTGALTASGGSWNAAIVAEYVKWGDDTVTAHGIGAYIAEATAEGDFPKIVLGVAVMSIFVTLFNRLLWRPLFGLAERRLRLD